MPELLLLAVASSAWPALIAVVVVAIRTENPPKILFSFLAGGMIATVGEGAAIVFALRGTRFVSGPRPTADPAILIAVGVLAPVAAYVMYLMGDTRGAGNRKAVEQKTRWSSWIERAVTHGGLLAFLAGVVLNIVPGVFPLVALKDIAEGDIGAVQTIVIIFWFYLVMFWMLELPLLAYVLAPRKTAHAVTTFDTWLTLNGRKIAEIVLVAVGAYAMVRGVLTLLR